MSMDLISTSYPGHNCPGLIEAAEEIPPNHLNPAVIRGITAPASLKQRREPRQTDPGPRILKLSGA
ncbi:protein of unknown function [Candidatus Methylocalor cossyra]|uniref:Uncharacterized protein n=1 Tax=Candidatus Methylocalor cossyra TaxID=3108543 RepID=A0ABM9NJ18_9GAMM